MSRSLEKNLSRIYVLTGMNAQPFYHTVGTILFTFLSFLPIHTVFCHESAEEHSDHGQQFIGNAQSRSSKAFGAIPLSHKNADASCVFITSDQQQIPVVSWIEKTQQNSETNIQMFFARWSLEKNVFLPPVSIPVPQNISVHEEGMPKLFFRPDGNIFTVFESSVPSPGKKWGVVTLNYITSADNGTTWSAPHPIVANTSLSETQTFSGVTQLQDGSLGITWLDNHTDAQNNEQRGVMFARFDNGKLVSKPVMVEPRACECCRIAITQNSDGKIILAYRSLREEATRDLSYVQSRDNGNSFSHPVDFSHNNWILRACPHNGPAIASSSASKNTVASFVTWFSGGKEPGVYIAKLDSQGVVSQNKQIDVQGRFSQITTLHDGTPIVAYSISDQSGVPITTGIRVSKMTDSGFKTALIGFSERNANYPVLAPIKDQQIAVAWRDNNTVFYRLIDTAMLSAYDLSDQ